ncbi:MAG: hypothetical protein IAG10_07395 [Planctomycetaceae bacterium]|nr:hypothetical protein [Planctomycetaceae bacterium]
MMKVEVVLEALDNERYRASTRYPFDLSAEATTREETLAALKDLLDSKLAQVEVVELEVGTPTEPAWKTIVGTWKDHPDMDEVLENMREYRRQVNADPNRL